MEDIIELPCESNGVEGESTNPDADIEDGQLVTDSVDDIIQDGAVAVNSGVVSEQNGDGAVFVDSADAKDDVSMPSDIDSDLGAEKMRKMPDEQQPSVHVKYYSLSRQSKQKLEELLWHWSEWHVQHPPEIPDQNGGSETGEGIYFPALGIGTKKTSAVSFWMENEIRMPENNDFVPVEDGSVPLYDRGFALGSADGSSNLEGGFELMDAPRCFNCGSYSHALKECPKPRNNAAVNSSRKQLKSKRNQTAGMRNASRYYQDTPGGKYEGLRPGVLDSETRRLLGLGEFDPPPWLNRMRDIGYPPGYLEPEDEDLPSGIIIYADEEIKDDNENKEEGEILESEQVEPTRKKSVLFPGINAPIPENADERVWAPGSSNQDRHRNGDFQSNYSSDSNRRRHRDYNNNNNNRDFKDSDIFGSESASKYPRRHSERDNSSSHSSRRNAIDSEDSIVSRLYSSYSYNSSDQPDYSSRGRDRDDRYRHGR